MVKMFFNDARRKWVEVEMVEKATSEETIEILREIFATHGLPHWVVTYNATVFTICEMKEFLKRNAIGSITSSPYHPSTNGLAVSLKSICICIPKHTSEDNWSNSS